MVFRGFVLPLVLVSPDSQLLAFMAPKTDNIVEIHLALLFVGGTGDRQEYSCEWCSPPASLQRLARACVLFYSVTWADNSEPPACRAMENRADANIYSTQWQTQ